ncbi:TYRO protein tyrosine kinase-binding protein [Zonotrichia leucophrys gambelii]|uniref:TYRO protein tyrosine kinase-binding protein n=1 Tax=Zonotrichia leucophrys gambelii TaxID=257770 RepID=UPI00314038AF
MAPPGTLGLVLLLLLAPGLAAAQSGPGPITALVVGDVILTLLIAGGAYWLAWRSHRAPPKPRPLEPESHYQELQGARGDIYSELKR